MVRDPTAWLPIALSLVALAEVIVYVALFGVAGRRNDDEGLPARLFQVLLLVVGLLIVAFAVRWLPRAPRDAVRILALQILAAAVPVATILVLESRAVSS